MLDGNGVLQSLISTPRFVSKTAAYTITAKESGTWFNDVGATAAVTFTLPKISDGPWFFVFLVSTDTGITVAAETADTMIAFNDVAADSVGLVTTAEAIGGIIIAASDGTSCWGITPIVSDAVTVTVTTN